MYNLYKHKIIDKIGHLKRYRIIYMLFKIIGERDDLRMYRRYVKAMEN